MEVVVVTIAGEFERKERRTTVLVFSVGLVLRATESVY
jgi:hypothetical protein